MLCTWYFCDRQPKLFDRDSVHQKARFELLDPLTAGFAQLLTTHYLQ
jgi:hypothetical protein